MLLTWLFYPLEKNITKNFFFLFRLISIPSYRILSERNIEIYRHIAFEVVHVRATRVPI